MIANADTDIPEVAVTLKGDFGHKTLKFPATTTLQEILDKCSTATELSVDPAHMHLDSTQNTTLKSIGIENSPALLHYTQIEVNAGELTAIQQKEMSEAKEAKRPVEKLKKTTKGVDEKNQNLKRKFLNDDYIKIEQKESTIKVNKEKKRLNVEASSLEEAEKKQKLLRRIEQEIAEFIEEKKRLDEAKKYCAEMDKKLTKWGKPNRKDWTVLECAEYFKRMERGVKIWKLFAIFGVCILIVWIPSFVVSGIWTLMNNLLMPNDPKTIWQIMGNKTLPALMTIGPMFLFFSWFMSIPRPDYTRDNLFERLVPVLDKDEDKSWINKRMSLMFIFKIR